MTLLGCGSQESTPTSATPAPASKSEAAPERLIFAFQRQKDPAALKEDADAMGKMLSTNLEIPVDVLVPTSYGATVQALISNRAHVAYLSSLPFMLAEREAKVEILLVEERDGKTSYDSVLVVRADAPITDPAALRGKRMAFTSPTSASGYVFPMGYIAEKGFIQKGEKADTFFGQTTFAGGYDRALLAVLNGQADVAAVSDYTMEGPTADKYLSAEQRSKLRILDRIPNVPTHLIAIRSDLPEGMKQRIRETLLKMANEEPERLKDVYGAATLVEPKSDHVAQTRKTLEVTGLDRAEVVEK
jgi:phosphonate transport system substrate-binding protein